MAIGIPPNPIQVTPYRGTNLTQLALNRRDFNESQRRFNTQSAQAERRLELTDQQLDQAAQRLNMDRRQFLTQLRQEIIDTSPNADVALNRMGMIREVDPEVARAFRAAPPETFGAKLVDQQNEVRRLDQADRAADQRDRAAEQRDAEIEIKRDAEERQLNKLSAQSEKELIEATDLAVDAGQSRQSLLTLAQDFEQRGEEIVGGAAGDAREALRALTGKQDAVSLLRTRYSAIRASQAVKNLPPGVASDKDIELALSGFLPPSANPQEIASFLRGMAKLEAVEEGFNRFKAEYINKNNGVRGLLEAWDASPESEAIRDRLVQPASQQQPSGTTVGRFTVRAKGS